MINTMEVAPEELPGLDLFQNCRLCLAKEKVSVDIFSEGHEIRLLYYKIVSCLPVHVTQDDKLPRKICMQCNEKVDNFYQFWTLTAKSQKTLLDWVEKKDLLPPAKIKTENVPPGEVLFKQEVPDYSDEDNDNDNDRYEDDNSEEDLEPSTVVKVCEETEETAGGTTPGPSAGTKIKLVENNENVYDVSNQNIVFKVKSADLVASFESDNLDGLRCKLCGFLSETITLAVIHFLDCKKRRNKVYECTICRKTYNTMRSLKDHLKARHKIKLKRKLIGPKTKYVCDYCRKKFTKKTELHSHILGHMNLKPYSCDFCESQFKMKTAFRHHIMTKHLKTSETTENEKSLACSICSKLCKSHKGLLSHEARHKITEHFECFFCKKIYLNKNNLAIHIQNVHLKSELEKRQVPPKKFICDICGNTYCRKSGLTDHSKREHEAGGKPSCKICGKTVCDKKSLAIHMNTHTGEKPHCCEICGRAFSSAAYLRVHIYCHTGETPHVCHVCPKKFRQRSSYTLHYKTNHPGIVPPKLR